MAFTINLSRPAEVPVTIQWATVDGTALAGLDYVAATGSLLIGVGEQSGTLWVDLLGDAVEEGDEYSMAAITGAVGVFVGDGSGRITISNDDTSVTVSVSVIDDSASGVGSDPASFEISRDGDPGSTLSVRLQ